MHRLQFVTQFVEHPTALNVATLMALVVIALAGCYLLSRLDLSVIVVVGLFLQLFSGNWALMGIPLPLDRVVLAVALIVLVLKGARWVCARRLVLRPLHVAMLCAATWAVASGIIAGTLVGHLGFYSLLDRFGVVPFAMFTLAPLIFGTAKQRNNLLIGLVAIGLYLGATGVFEGLHIWRLVFPSYIANPDFGIQFGRARGPILESTGDGFCILCGMVAAAIALTSWRSQWARLACYLTIALGGAALFFTLTRSVWIGGFLGVVGAMLLSHKTRRILGPGPSHRDGGGGSDVGGFTPHPLGDNRSYREPITCMGPREHRYRRPEDHFEVPAHGGGLGEFHQCVVAVHAPAAQLSHHRRRPRSPQHLPVPHGRARHTRPIVMAGRFSRRSVAGIFSVPLVARPRWKRRFTSTA